MVQADAMHRANQRNARPRVYNSVITGFASAQVRFSRRARVYGVSLSRNKMLTTGLRHFYLDRRARVVFENKTFPIFLFIGRLPSRSPQGRHSVLTIWKRRRLTLFLSFFLSGSSLFLCFSLSRRLADDSICPLCSTRTAYEENDGASR